MILEEKKQGGKRKRILDQIYNGAFTNLELSKKSKAAFINSGLLIGLSLLASFYIISNKKK